MLSEQWSITLPFNRPLLSLILARLVWGSLKIMLIPLDSKLCRSVLHVGWIFWTHSKPILHIPENPYPCRHAPENLTHPERLLHCCRVRVKWFCRNYPKIIFAKSWGIVSNRWLVLYWEPGFVPPDCVETFVPHSCPAYLYD